MSLLSSVTGIHISKHGVHIEPLKALGTLATVGSFGGLGPLAGIAGKVGSVASHIPGAATAASALSKVGSVASHIPGAGAIEQAVQSHGGLSGIAGSALDYAKNNPSQILAGLQVANAASLGKKSNQYADKAYDSANQSYMDRAGLRSAGIEGMLHPQIPDTSQFARIRSSNPYAGAPPAATALPLARAA